MKKLLCVFILLQTSIFVFSQATIIFWTNDQSACPIDVYVNGYYRGQITRAYGNAPDCGASGCVTVTIGSGRNTFKAIGQNGSWESFKTPPNYSHECYAQRLSKSDKITHKSTSDNSSYNDENKSTSTSTPSYSSNNNDDVLTPLAEAGAKAAIGLAAAVVTLVVMYASDLYITGVFSGNYSGFEFGLRNSWNKYIDVEYGISYYKLGAWGNPSNILGSDFYGKSVRKNYYISGYGYYQGNSYDDAPVHLWGANFNFLFNFIERPYINRGYVYGGIRDDRNRFGRRNPIANPFMGICTHLFFGHKNKNYSSTYQSLSFNRGATFAIGPCAGVHLAAGNKVKFSLRYTFLYNFEREKIAAHHFEAGFIFKYQLIQPWEK
jgi:hypothetical protein